MTTHTTHTPLPWAWENNDPANPRGSYIYGPKREAIVRLPFWLDKDPMEEMRGNARLIVHCVNTYPALVEALEACQVALANLQEHQRWGKWDHNDDIDEAVDALGEASKALAIARKENV